MFSGNPPPIDRSGLRQPNILNDQPTYRIDFDTDLFLPILVRNEEGRREEDFGEDILAGLNQLNRQRVRNLPTTRLPRRDETFTYQWNPYIARERASDAVVSYLGENNQNPYFRSTNPVRDHNIERTIHETIRDFGVESRNSIDVLQRYSRRLAEKLNGMTPSEALRTFKHSFNIPNIIGYEAYNSLKERAEELTTLLTSEYEFETNQPLYKKLNAVSLLGATIAEGLEPLLSTMRQYSESTLQYSNAESSLQDIDEYYPEKENNPILQDELDEMMAFPDEPIIRETNDDPVGVIPIMSSDKDSFFWVVPEHRKSVLDPIFNALRTGIPMNEILDQFFEEFNDFEEDGPNLMGSDPQLKQIISMPVDDWNIQVSFRQHRFPKFKGKSNHSRRRGGWAPFTCRFKGLDLHRQQIETSGTGFKNSSLPCLVHACKMSGQFTEPELDEMCRFLAQPITLIVNLKKIGAHFNTKFIVTGMDRHRKEYGPKDATRVIDLGLYKEHLFLNEMIPVTRYALKNWDRVFNKFKHGRVRKINRVEREVDESLSSVAVITALDSLNAFEPLSWTDTEAIQAGFNQIWAFNDKLEYCHTFCPKFQIKEPDVPLHESIIFYGDFESCTNGLIHEPFLFAMTGWGGFKKVLYFPPETENQIWTQALIGTIIAGWKHFYNYGDKMYIFFHNLDYDSSFILRFLGQYCVGALITNNNTILGYNIKLPKFDTMICFRDSYRYITAPLRNFGKMFNLEIEKEVYPYNYYTVERLQSLREGRWGSTAEFVNEMEPQRRDELIQKIQRFLNPNNPNEVDAIGYSAYYCIIDCEVLQKGFDTFRKQLIEFTNLDPLNYFTISSIAYSTLISKGVFDGCHNLSGPPLFFIRKCVNGGRCMLRCNKQQLVDGPIADFDAVSLYPSAMKRLWTIKGLPKIIPEGWTLDELRQKANDFFIEIEINRVPKHLEFPLIARQRGEFKVYDNQPTKSLFVDNIWLEDLKTFHEIEDDDIVLKRGYYYDEGRNYTIRDVIQYLFDKRLEYKAQKNPLEQIVKLLMNSCYGKSILKPVLYEKRIVDDDTLTRLLSSKRSAVMAFAPIDKSSNYLYKENAKLKSVKGFPTFGVQVLSMSKRIMSEVMVTAQDISVPIFYTDTDSVHIMEDDIPKLAAAFNEKYGRELIGKALGQFHSDFSVAGQDGDWYSEQFIGIGKKCYLDILRDRNDPSKKEYHVRIKGIPTDAFFQICEDFGCTPEQLAHRLYRGERITFNLLTNGRVSFGRTKGLGRTTRSEFKRQISFLERFAFTVDQDPEEI